MSCFCLSNLFSLTVGSSKSYFLQ
uniref:Uncharacterized protein n=1 Tax=Arundo donax TaxID=35708 RepID=A0A0A8ZE23_ARUDO